MEQPKLYPAVHYIKGDIDIESKVNDWIKAQSDAEIKSIRTITSGEYIVVELVYVRYPKPTPSPIKKEK